VQREMQQYVAEIQKLQHEGEVREREHIAETRRLESRVGAKVGALPV
jgi:hypothetical protein